MTRMPQYFHSRLPLAVGLLTAVLMIACASAPPLPTSSLQAAQQAISNAERVEAGRYAAGDLSAARARLASAMRPPAKKKMLLAEQLADESRG